MSPIVSPGPGSTLTNPAADAEHALSPESQVTVHLVNAFAYQGRGGSPTGIVVNSPALSEERMQRIASLSMASHVVFIRAPSLSGLDCQVRFFTKGGEIKNCAHATIAAHWFLASRAHWKENRVVWQETMTGKQQVWIETQDQGYSVRFAQQVVDLVPADRGAIMDVLAPLHVVPSDLSQQHSIQLASPGSYRFLIPVRSRRILTSIRPEFSALQDACERHDSIGCFVYCLEGDERDRIAHGRMFAPVIGVPEDVVNGNSSGCLGAYLLTTARKRGAALQELALEVFQGTALGTIGRVNILAKLEGPQTRTYIEGTAWHSGQETARAEA